MSSHRCVYKYPLPLSGRASEVMKLRLPAGSKIMKVAEQGIDPVLGPLIFLWALVDPDESLQELRYVVMAGTGHKIELDVLSDKSWDFNDTLLCLGGKFVLHVWVSRAEGKETVEVSETF